MCEDCGGICAIFDRMFREYAEEVLGQSYDFSEGYKSKFHSTNVKGITGTDGKADSTNLAELIEQAACIGMTPQELETELAKRSGFGEAATLWIKEQKVPCGMVRKMLLQNVEAIIREHGARPQHSMEMLEAA